MRTDTPVTIMFTPPTRTERGCRWHPLFSRTSLQVGVTVLKEGGFYRQVIEPSAEEVSGADVTYQGGRSYPITTAERDDLVAAGYGPYIEGAP